MGGVPRQGRRLSRGRLHCQPIGSPGSHDVELQLFAGENFEHPGHQLAGTPLGQFAKRRGPRGISENGIDLSRAFAGGKACLSYIGFYPNRSIGLPVSTFHYPTAQVSNPAIRFKVF